MSTNARMGFLAFLMIFGIAAAVGVCVLAYTGWQKKMGESGTPGVSRPLIGGPSESAEGMNWSKAELVEYLKSRGMAKAGLVRIKYQDYIFMGDGAEVSEEREIPGNAVRLDAIGGNILATPSKATIKDQVDRANRNHPGCAFAWGRFYCKGDPAVIRQIRSALE